MLRHVYVIIMLYHVAPQALGGLIVQRTENQALLIWDHGVLMREKVIYWDCLQARTLPLFVRENLIRLHRVTGQCLYYASDAVLPCNASFNTKWEVGGLNRVDIWCPLVY